MEIDRVDEAYRLKLEIETKTAEFALSIKPLAVKLKELQDAIKAVGVGSYEGAVGKATVSIRKNVAMSACAVWDAVQDPVEFLPLVKVSVPAAKKFLSEEAFDNAATTTETTVLKLSAKS